VPHTLRHSYATLLAQTGVPDRTIMAILGHSSLATVVKYEHALPEHLAQAALRLDQALNR
jgi:site-specific recombinase XerD